MWRDSPSKVTLSYVQDDTKITHEFDSVVDVYTMATNMKNFMLAIGFYDETVREVFTEDVYE